MNRRMVLGALALIVLAASVFAFHQTRNEEEGKKNMGVSSGRTEKATFGGGCFWCIEAVFSRYDGVLSAVSGYAGGSVANPTYKQVCTGSTGHAEVVQIEFDPAVITYEQMLDIFWQAHDPTTLNRQGNDAGTQYRSIIFYQDEKQKATAEKSRAAIANDFSDPVVTEIKPLTAFYKAEESHQDYYDNNKSVPYCRYVISPKLEKLKLKK